MTISKFIENNIRSIALSLGGVILVCIAAAAVLELKSEREAKAQGQLWETKLHVEQFLNEKKYSEAQDALGQIISQFKGTHAAFDASLSLADILVQQKNYSAAVEQYANAVSNAPDSFSKMLATYNRGTAEEQAGKCDQAVKSYQEAMHFGLGDFMTPELMMAEARCWEQLGDKAKAIALYKDVREKFANKAYYSAAAAVFQQHLGEVKN